MPNRHRDESTASTARVRFRTNCRSRLFGDLATGRCGRCSASCTAPRSCRARGKLASVDRSDALLRRLKRREERVATRNIELCFGELDAAERRHLLDRHFVAVGMSFVEMGIGWFTPIERLLRTRGASTAASTSIARSQRGRGALLFAAHFTTLEVGVRRARGAHAASELHVSAATQRDDGRDDPPRPLSVRQAADSARQRARAACAACATATPSVYLPDQTYLGNQSELAAVLRRAGRHEYRDEQARGDQRRDGAAVFFPPLAERRLSRRHRPAARRFSERVRRRAIRSGCSALLEDYIRLAPEQYLWLYKKFKGRPAPFAGRVRALTASVTTELEE